VSDPASSCRDAEAALPCEGPFDLVEYLGRPEWDEELCVREAQERVEQRVGDEDARIEDDCWRHGSAGRLEAFGREAFGCRLTGQGSECLAAFVAGAVTVLYEVGETHSSVAAGLGEGDHTVTEESYDGGP